MIRYKITLRELERRVDKQSPQWRSKARDHAVLMKSKKKYEKGGPSWSAIKSVYAALQYYKCAYCEKKLESTNFETGENVGAIEQDMEHYRPKNGVKTWVVESEKYNFEIKSGTQSGYYMLAHSLQNYCVSCKTCNSTFKSNYFPIAAEPGQAGETDVSKLFKQERPFLIYPIGRIDEDPAKILTFKGFHLVPKTRRGQKHARALVTIDFFGLNLRENLIRERCEVIYKVYKALEAFGSADARQREEGELDLNAFTHDSHPHAHCARAFKTLFMENVDKATYYFELARQIIRNRVGFKLLI